MKNSACVSCVHLLKSHLDSGTIRYKLTLNTCSTTAWCWLSAGWRISGTSSRFMGSDSLYGYGLDPEPSPGPVDPG